MSIKDVYQQIFILILGIFLITISFLFPILFVPSYDNITIITILVSLFLFLIVLLVISIKKKMWLLFIPSIIAVISLFFSVYMVGNAISGI